MLRLQRSRISLAVSSISARTHARAQAGTRTALNKGNTHGQQIRTLDIVNLRLNRLAVFLMSKQSTREVGNGDQSNGDRTRQAAIRASSNSSEMEELKGREG
jgi:hypothetical protein